MFIPVSIPFQHCLQCFHSGSRIGPGQAGLRAGTAGLLLPGKRVQHVHAAGLSLHPQPVSANGLSLLHSLSSSLPSPPPPPPSLFTQDTRHPRDQDTPVGAAVLQQLEPLGPACKRDHTRRQPLRPASVWSVLYVCW